MITMQSDHVEPLEPTGRRFDLARVTFQLLTIGALMLMSFWILRPFLMPAAWAVMIVVATWPLLRWIQARLGGRRGLAATVMTLALVLVFAAPAYLGVMTLVAAARHATELTQRLAGVTIPPPPAWLDTLPTVGPAIAERWQRFVAGGPAELAAFLVPYARGFAVGLVSRIGGFGHLILDILLTIVIAAILYVTGETAVHGARRFAHRLGGRQAEAALHLAGQAIRAVALGVIVTAFFKSALSGIGLAVTGVPFAAILSVVVFVLSIAHVGPIPVLAPAIIWLYVRDGAGWATALAVWTIVLVVVDHIIAPLLIKRGADLPLLLIFAGVLGGLIAFGVIGLFIGPLVLAVAHTLVAAWVAQDHETPPASATSEARGGVDPAAVMSTR